MSEKTLIVYATKYGATAEIAQRIASHLKGAKVHDLASGPAPNLSAYSTIIVGSAIYAGSIRREAKSFVKQHEAELMDKKLGLYVSALDKNAAEADFLKNFPQDICETALAKDLLGGIFNPESADLIEKMVVKIAMKKVEYINTIDDDKIAAFAAALK